MGAPAGLVNIDDVKAWVYEEPSQETDENLELLLALISRISRLTLNTINRSTFAARSISEVRDGTGGRLLMLGNFPVVSVSLVVAGGLEIAGAPAPAAGQTPQRGYSLEAWDGFPPGRHQCISLNGYTFPRGLQNVRVDYVTGYQVSAEPQTIVAGAATIAAPNGPWLADGSVSFADGTALVPVASNPAQGQYALDSTTAGKYLFNTADNGKPVAITYSYTPADVYHAVIEWIKERYAYMERTGIASKAVGAQATTAYIVKGVPDFIQQVLSSYRNVIPI